MLTIILTSYNRPHFVRRAIQSVLDQTDPNWRLLIQEDGSDIETMQAVYSFNDGRISVTQHETADDERKKSSRYAVLINQAYMLVHTPLIMYMCDNVEYAPDMVASVNRYFGCNPDVWSGYILQTRDVWNTAGTERLGAAQSYGHWPEMPPNEMPITQPQGVLDHSQVVHRLPVSARWEESIDTVKFGDAVFFERLVAEHGAIRPIRPGRILSYEHILH